METTLMIVNHKNICFIVYHLPLVPMTLFSIKKKTWKIMCTNACVTTRDEAILFSPPFYLVAILPYLSFLLLFHPLILDFRTARSVVFVSRGRRY